MPLPRGAPRSRRPSARPVLAVLVATWLLVVGAALTPSRVVAAQQEIASIGPLTRIIVTDDLNCQVAHQADTAFEFFGGEIGACGTFLAVDGRLFGPAFVPAGLGLGGLTPWTPVSQSAVSGNGSSGALA